MRLVCKDERAKATRIFGRATVRGLESDEDMPRTTSSILAGRSATAERNHKVSPRPRVASLLDDSDYSLPHPMPLLQTMSIGQPMLISTKSREMWSSMSSPTFAIMST